MYLYAWLPHHDVPGPNSIYHAHCVIHTDIIISVTYVSVFCSFSSAKLKFENKPRQCLFSIDGSYSTRRTNSSFFHNI